MNIRGYGNLWIYFLAIFSKSSISRSFSVTKTNIYFSTRTANVAIIRIIKNIPSDTSKLPRSIKNAKKNPKHSAMPKIAPTSTSIIMAMLDRLYQMLDLSGLFRFEPFRFALPHESIGKSSASNRRFLMRFFI